MDKPRHTPGPWHRNIKPAKKYNTIYAGRNTHVAHLTVTGLTDESTMTRILKGKKYRRDLL